MRVWAVSCAAKLCFAACSSEAQRCSEVLRQVSAKVAT
jgi:hypothetical protein